MRLHFNLTLNSKVGFTVSGKKKMVVTLSLQWVVLSCHGSLSCRNCCRVRAVRGCGKRSSPPALPSTSRLAFDSSVHPSGSQFLNVLNTFLVHCYSSRRARLGCAAVTDNSKNLSSSNNKGLFLVHTLCPSQARKGLPLLSLPVGQVDGAATS